MSETPARSVLVAAADAESAARLAEILDAAGFAVSQTQELESLAAEVDRLDPQALVVDLPIEAQNALDTLEELTRMPSPPALFVAAPPDLLGSECACFESPCVEVLPQPVPEKLLLSRIRAAFDRSGELEERLRHHQQVGSILEITQALNSTLDSGAILYFIARKLSEAMELQRCSFIVPDVSLGVGRVIACKDDPNIHSLEINLDNYPEIKRVLSSGSRVLISDVEGDPIMTEVRRFADVFRDQSIMTLPLKLHGHIIGVLQIRKRSEEKGFSEEQIEFAELLANHAASALRNARLYEERERQNRELSSQKSELEALSEQLKRNNEELVKLTELKDDFTSMVVHDLRSPMTVVQGVLDLLQLKLGPDSPDRELIQDGLSVTRKMLRLINNLLEVTRLESGELTLRCEVLNVADLIRETVEPLQVMAAKQGVRLETEVSDLGLALKGDRSRLAQVLDNLVTNAIKFTPAGGEVRLVAQPDSDAETPGVRIDVHDTGPGMPEEELPHIFKRFRQGRTGAGRRKGTGLGLTIVELLVRAHQGTVHVESAQGEGSRFTIHLPTEPTRAEVQTPPLG